MSWRSCRQQEQPLSVWQDCGTSPAQPQPARGTGITPKEPIWHTQNSKFKAWTFFTPLQHWVSEGLRSWISAATKSSKYGSHFETQAQGPRKGKWILAVHKDRAVNQAALWSLSGCLPCSAHVLTAELSLTSGFPWCWEQHSVPAPWLEMPQPSSTSLMNAACISWN